MSGLSPKTKACLALARFPGTDGLVKLVKQGTNPLLEARIYGEGGWLTTP